MLKPFSKKKEYEVYFNKDTYLFIEKLKKKDRTFYLEIYKKLIKIKENPYNGKLLSRKSKIILVNE